MRRLLIFSLPFLFVTPVSAREITHTIVDSVQLTVDAPTLTSNRIGSSYSVSGTNISAANGDSGANSLGQLASPSATAPALITDGTYSVKTDGQAFSFSESATVGDTVVTSQAAIGTAGTVAQPNLYGQTTQYQGGTAGSLAGTLSATSIPTVTAGGAGTTAIGQRSIELSVFK